MRYWPRGIGIAKCPFYITDSRHTISCEAACGTGAERTRIVFEREEDKDHYLKENCVEIEPKCRYYHMLYHDEKL